MKKVKIMLTAIAVFAIMGGAMAFKAQKKYGRIIYTTTNPVLGCTCPYPKFDYTITNIDPGTVKISVAITINFPCVLSWIKAAI